MCIRDSLKGSREVVEKLQNLINDNVLKDKVTLSGKFCMGNCQNGVSVTVDGELFSVSPDTDVYKRQPLCRSPSEFQVPKRANLLRLKLPSLPINLYFCIRIKNIF